jgi:anti-anti-sigma regulatory factor
MSEARTFIPVQPPTVTGEIGVVHAGDYVNKLSGLRIERECRIKLENGCCALIINFKGTELVNSIGVSILLGVIDIAEQKRAPVVFTNVNRHTFKLFELLGLTRHVSMAESEEAARDALSDFFASSLPAGH